MQPLLMVSEPTSGGLLVRGVACLYSFKTYLKGDCWPGEQPVYMVSDSTYRGLLAQGAACLHGFKTYLLLVWVRKDLTVSEPFQECVL